MSMRIGIIGAGALGTLFGYRLAHDHDVSMLEIRPDVVAAVRENGLGIAENEARRAVLAHSHLSGMAVSWFETLQRVLLTSPCKGESREGIGLFICFI